jgi:hypothetical protein
LRRPSRCESFIGFVQEAWHVLQPNNAYVHNWHADAIGEYLEAVTYGKINPRLLINVPPGTSKSLLISVFWPAWEWGPAGLASLRYLSTSYSDSYVSRDSRRMRDLVASDWYQERWGDHVQLVRTGETSFENTASGGPRQGGDGHLCRRRPVPAAPDDPRGRAVQAGMVQDGQGNPRRRQVGAALGPGRDRRPDGL